MRSKKDNEEHKKEDDDQSFLKGSFFVKKNNLLYNLKIDDIIYIKSEGNYCDIITTEKFAIKKSLTQLLKQLPSARFVRIHQRYAIQLDQIDFIDTRLNQISVGGKNLPLGPKFKDDLLKRIEKF